jgi:hypothetical protein
MEIKRWRSEKIEEVKLSKKTDKLTVVLATIGIFGLAYLVYASIY